MFLKLIIFSTFFRFKLDRSRGKKRQMVLKFAKYLLRLKTNQPLTLQVKEPSQAFLEEDLSGESIDPRLPPEVIYMLRGVRVFGFFDKPLFLELCRQLEVINVANGQLFFSIGDADDSIYIVQSGQLEVYVTEHNGSEIVLKEAIAGDMIASLLSVLDVLSGHLAPFKTVSARAKQDSIVLRLQVQSFKNLLEKYPEMMVRVVQVIMVRLQRVTFTALHNYLGLSTQLINYGKQLAGSPTKTSASRPSRVSVIHNLQSSQSATEPECNDIIRDLKELATEMKSSEAPAEQSTTDYPLDANISQPPPPASELRPLHAESPIKQKSLNLFTERVKRKKSVINEEKLAQVNEENLKQAAIEQLTQHLKLEDSNLVASIVQLQEFAPGDMITREDSYDESAIHYILSGTTLTSQKNAESNGDSNLYLSHPGDFVGILEVLTGEVPPFTVKARTACKMAVLPKQAVYDLVGKHPHVCLELANQVVKRLSTFVRQIDFALDWVHYKSGQAIYRQGDEPDSTYIVLSGRLRSAITRPNGKKEFVGEYGRGDLVGIVEVLTQTNRSTTSIAVRDSEVAKLPAGLLDFIKIKHPVVVTRLIHLLGHRILGSLQQVSSNRLPLESGYTRPNVSNFATVAILAVNDEVPVQAFCLELNHALKGIDNTLLLTSELIRKTLGTSALESSNEYRLSSWLAQQEDQHKVVLYQCDNNFSAWTRRCIRQADCILIVAVGDQKPTVGKVEKQLESLTVRTQKELILLHKSTGERPKNTVEWLNIRSWCSSHHHIRCPKKVFLPRSFSKLKDYQQLLEKSQIDIHSDFSRLARFLTGTSIGLVLGGGGARGASHVGMLQAITEAGIPIDMVGGVSIGAFMGALYCMETDVDRVREKARRWAMGLTKIWRMLLDLTYPATAMFTGAFFNRSIYEALDEHVQIEDLWLPYFTITTDITASCPRIHRFGSLWRYVRSSMSLSGYLPPLCDPVDGHLLLDGGYVNNLPADVMRDVMGAQNILAVDVGSQDEMDFTNYGDRLNGWWLLWNRWMPSFVTQPLKVPNLPDIQSRLAYVSCVRQLEEVKRSDYCTYIRPPIDRWSTLQFKSFDEIEAVGLSHGRELFAKILEEGSDTCLRLAHLSQVTKLHPASQNSQCFGTFTDLAEKVCKIKAPARSQQFLSVSEYEEDEEEEDTDCDAYNCYISEPELSASNRDLEEYARLGKLRDRKGSTLF
jgi:lysophospholipid hydrolase